MKLIGEPKEKVKASGGIDDARQALEVAPLPGYELRAVDAPEVHVDDAKQALEDTGMELNDEELDKVAGGWPLPRCPEPLQPYGEIV